MVLFKRGALQSAIRDGRHFKTAEAKRHTLGDLIDRYIEDVLPLKKKSEKKQKAQLLWWKRQIGVYLLSDVTPACIAEQRDKFFHEPVRNGKSRSPSTVVRYMAALSHAYSIAVKEWGWLEDSPMRKVTKPKEPRGRVRFLSSEEREKLLDACKNSSNRFLYLAVLLALSTGMRQGELLNLRWGDLDLQKGRAILHETKNGDRRVVPIAGAALQLLREHEKIRRIDTTLLFPGKDPRKPADLRCAWEAALKTSGIADFRWHDLRHSAASELCMMGASLAEIAEVLGHKTMSMVKRYSHLSDAHTAGVVAKMNEKVFG